MPVKESIKNRLKASGIQVDAMKGGKTTRVNDKTIRESKQARREMCLRALRNGDPFPLIRYEWPELIITDPDELRVFKQVCERKDHLDLRFDDFQIEAIRASFDRMHSQLMISGGTKLGKGLIVGGFIVNLWFEAHPDCKILLVGPSVTHVQDNLYAETRKWRAKMTSYKDGDVVPDLLSEKMWYTDRPEHWVKIVNPDSGEGFSGSHSPHTLIVMDESSDQPDERYRDALSQCASAFFIAISNPRKPSGFFWRAFIGFDQGWKTVMSDVGPRKLISVGLAHCLNVRARRVAGLVAPSATFPFGPYEIDGEVVPPSSVIPEHLRKHTQLLIPGQGDCVSVATLISECPDDEVQWRVYGKFPDSNKDFMLFQRTFRDIAVAQHAKVAEQIRFRALGIDVASSVAGDYCSLAYGDEKGCKGYRLERNPNLVMLKGWVLGWCRSEFCVTLTDGTYPVGIDPLGLGQGLADMLEMDGVWIIRVGASSAPERNKESYLNRRAEMYGDLSYAVNPKFFGEDDGQRKEPFALPDDEMLWGELFAIEKIYGRDGRKIQLNSKRPVKSLKAQQRTDNRDSIQEKIRRSPDRADSVAFLYQAVMELPEFLGVTMTQYDPSHYLRSYTEICGEVQYTDWTGEEFRVSREEFLLKYGENPPLLPA